jgi:hypothetical protein
MTRDPRLTPIPSKSVAAPPEVVNEFRNKWKKELKSIRRRKGLFYILSTVWGGISFSTIRYWANVYTRYRDSFTWVARSSEELANAFQTVLGIIMQRVGLAALALASVGLVNAMWLRYRHERPIRNALHEAHGTDYHQDVLRCSGSSESHWQGFEQQTRRYLIGYLIATGVGLTLVIAGTAIP